MNRSLYCPWNAQSCWTDPAPGVTCCWRVEVQSRLIRSFTCLLIYLFELTHSDTDSLKTLTQTLTQALSQALTQALTHSPGHTRSHTFYLFFLTHVFHYSVYFRIYSHTHIFLFIHKRPYLPLPLSLTLLLIH